MKAKSTKTTEAAVNKAAKAAASKASASVKAKANGLSVAVNTAIASLISAEKARALGISNANSALEELSLVLSKESTYEEADKIVRPILKEGYALAGATNAHTMSQISRILSLAFPKQGKAEGQELAKIRKQYEQAKEAGIPLAERVGICTGNKILVDGELVKVEASANDAAPGSVTGTRKGKGSGGHNRLSPLEEISGKLALLLTSLVTAKRMTSEEFSLAIIEWLKLNGFDSHVKGIEFFLEFSIDTVRHNAAKHTVTPPAPPAKPAKPKAKA